MASTSESSNHKCAKHYNYYVNPLISKMRDHYNKQRFILYPKRRPKPVSTVTQPSNRKQFISDNVRNNMYKARSYQTKQQPNRRQSTNNHPTCTNIIDNNAIYKRRTKSSHTNSCGPTSNQNRSRHTLPTPHTHTYT